MRRDTMKIILSAILVVLVVSIGSFAFLKREELANKLQEIGKRPKLPELADKTISKMDKPFSDETSSLKDPISNELPPLDDPVAMTTRKEESKPPVNKVDVNSPPKPWHTETKNDRGPNRERNGGGKGNRERNPEKPNDQNNPGSGYAPGIPDNPATGEPGSGVGGGNGSGYAPGTPSQPETKSKKLSTKLSDAKTENSDSEKPEMSSSRTRSKSKRSKQAYSHLHSKHHPKSHRHKTVSKRTRGSKSSTNEGYTKLDSRVKDLESQMKAQQETNKKIDALETRIGNLEKKVGM